jgi:hypothetical protein
MVMEKIKNDLTEAIYAYKNFMINNSIEISDGIREMIMDVSKIKEQKFLLENFNYCADEFGKKINEIAIQDENVKFNGKLDSVFKILQKFVKDECFKADFDMLEDEQTMQILKTWWNKNKHKFKD